MKTTPPFIRCALTAALGLAFQAAQAADVGAGQVPGDGSVFTLGQITVTSHREDERPIGTDSLNRETLRDFDKDGLAEALNLVPGVTSTSGAGSRNEALISVRGFDRWQVPLLMDGIRLYLPADNRIDFDRFLTPDLSEIQVSKGYVSVLNGPDGMGGAINLVTRKPVKAFESEVRASIAMGGEGQYNGNTVYANVGGRQESYYFQASVEQRDMDHWRLSDDFQPTQAENGGQRDHTSKKDWRINLKAGLTPNATDEYSLNFVKQRGEKHGIGSVTGTSSISTWDWPKWDTWSLYWLSHTQLGESSWLKTKAYYNKFENDLVAYTNTSLNTPNWTSYYDDNAKGVSLELGTEHFARQTLKAAFHYRRDDHTEWQLTHASGFTEPKQSTVEDTYSLAIEDTWHLTSRLDLIGGISRDWRKSRKAEEFRSGDGFFEQPTADSQATNYQAAAIYRYSGTGKVHLSYSDRTRFPTMFERFSSRFGGALSNPWLDPERARNVELGLADELLPGLRGEVALFHNRVKDAIQAVPIVYNGGNYSQSQNVGDATFKGLELGLTARLAQGLEVGGNYSYIDTRIDNPNDAAARLTTTPRHKALVYAKWQATGGLRVIPSLEYGSPRWSADAVKSSSYVKTGEYALLNLKLEYRLTPSWDVSLTGRNLLDKNYALVDGYPQEGRNFLLATRLQF
ncbi:MAG: TonB-dependent receptor [Azovibrio sp.]|nr:TonB-dependent receptor [Azovibrio sp.]